MNIMYCVWENTSSGFEHSVYTFHKNWKDWKQALTSVHGAARKLLFKETLSINKF